MPAGSRASPAAPATPDVPIPSIRRIGLAENQPDHKNLQSGEAQVNRLVEWSIIAFFCGAAVAQAQTNNPMRSFGYETPTIGCNYRGSPSGDDRIPLSGKLDIGDPKNYTAPPAPPGSGVFPGGAFTIRKVFIAHVVNTSSGSVTDAYAVAGHSGMNGDWVTPMIIGANAMGENSYPADAPVKFAVGEYLDIHAGCTGAATHSVKMAVWYTVP